MHRFSTIVATSILLLGSICSAQQASVPSDKASGTSVNASSIAGNPGDSASPGPLSATNSYIPYFQNPVTGYTDSIMNQPNSTQISTAGNFGLSSYSYSYGIGGISVLSANHNYGTYNLSVGAQACSATNGSQNDVCVGDGAGQNIASNGKVNTFVGFRAGQLSTSGGWNVCVGAGACLYNGGATGNTSIGTYSGFNTTGSSNTFLGTGAGGSVTTGSSNIYIGPNAGNPSSPGESNTIRIGVNGAGAGQQNKVFIEPLENAPSFSSFVTINPATGQLGVYGSSRRFKQQIADMGDTSSKLLQLRPVTFFYKPEYDGTHHQLQYGLIAEEVAKVYPEMVADDKNGQPYTVSYQLLAPMLLNEFQKQHALVAAQQIELQTQLQWISAQRQEIDGLKLQLQQQNVSLQERLSKLESSVTTQMKTASDNPPPTTPVANGGLQ